MPPTGPVGRAGRPLSGGLVSLGETLNPNSDDTELPTACEYAGMLHFEEISRPERRRMTPTGYTTVAVLAHYEKIGSARQPF